MTDVTGGRREFLRSLGRVAGFLGLGSLAGYALLAGRRSPSGARRQLACVNRGLCPSCPELEDCRLPQAALGRRASRERAERR
jgi:hypothetical protein